MNQFWCLLFRFFGNVGDDPGGCNHPQLSSSILRQPTCSLFPKPFTMTPEGCIAPEYASERDCSAIPFSVYHRLAKTEDECLSVKTDECALYTSMGWQWLILILLSMIQTSIELPYRETVGWISDTVRSGCLFDIRTIMSHLVVGKLERNGQDRSTRLRFTRRSKEIWWNPFSNLFTIISVR